MKNIFALCEKYPFLEENSLGKSLCGRDIPLVTLGLGQEGVLLLGGVHGNESITSSIILKFLEELCKIISEDDINKPELLELLKKRKLYFVPTLNPDGCEISKKGEKQAGIYESTVKKLSYVGFDKWTANARGVDINHNFSAGWEELKCVEKMHGIFAPRHRRFGGFSPNSEPETKAIINFCKSKIPIRSYAFHTQGEVIYWDYDNIKVKDAEKIANLLASKSGYLLDCPTSLAVGGGFKDWFIKEFKMPAFTVELGKGQNPLPSEMGEEIYEKIKKMLFTMIYV